MKSIRLKDDTLLKKSEEESINARKTSKAELRQAARFPHNVTYSQQQHVYTHFIYVIRFLEQENKPLAFQMTLISVFNS